MIICSTEWDDNPDMEIDFYNTPIYRLSLRKRNGKYETYKKYHSGDMEEILTTSNYLQSVLNNANALRRQELNDHDTKDIECDHVNNIAKGCKKHMELDGQNHSYENYIDDRTGDY